MRFSGLITTVTRPLKVQIKGKDYEFLGDNNRMIVKVKEGLFVILGTGKTVKGEFENCSEELLYVEGEEIPLKSIIFIGKLC